MLERKEPTRPKDVMLINDIPVKTEVEQEEKFSSISNMNLITSLRTGKVNQYDRTPSTHKGIISTAIHSSYLNYSSFTDSNFDFKNDFKKRKDLQVLDNKLVDKDGNIYFKLDNQKDVYVYESLWKEFQALLTEIRIVQPKLIIVTGKWTLFFLTGCTSLVTNQGNAKDKKPLGGLNKFRSSILQISECWDIKHKCILIPIFHTINAMAMPDKVFIMELDIQKLGWMYHIIKDKGIDYYIKPEKEYLLGTTKEICLDYLSKLLKRIEVKPTHVSFDVETMFHSIIDCITVTDSIDFGMTIPFAHKNNANYFSLVDELEVMVALREVMLHPNCLHVGQNYQYDCQYYFKLWGLSISSSEDTMVLSHTLFNYLPKNLSFLASLFCEFFTYWKDDITAIQETPETRWIYCAKDGMYTLEVLQGLQQILEEEDDKLKALYYFQINKLYPQLISTMNTGFLVDKKRKDELYSFFLVLMEDIKVKINDCLGMQFNINSSQQKKKVFNDLLGITLITKKGSETCDAQATLTYIEENPLYKPFLTLLLEYASLKVTTTTFLGMKLDADNRARTQYGLTNTGRLNSKKNVWGTGGNLQNIPEKGKINLKFALQVLDESIEDDAEVNPLYDEFNVEGSIRLPNVKKIFLPDKGYEIADGDFSGADIMIVAADADCKWLLDFFANPKGKVYRYIANEFLQREITDTEYKIYKGVFHGCVTGDHEVLTKQGWVRVDEYNEEVELAVWDKDTKSIFFEVPSYFNRDFVEKEEDLYSIEGSSFSFLGTQDHKFPFMLSSGKIDKVEAVNLNKTARIPYSGNYIGTSLSLPEDFIRLIVALQADGTIKYTDIKGISTYAWRFVKERKVTRLIKILTNLGIPFTKNTYQETETKLVTNIEIKGYLENRFKKLDWYILDYSEKNLVTFVDELKYWDGNIRSSNGVRESFFTTDKHASEIVQTVTHLVGKGSKVITKLRDETRKTLYEVSSNNRTYYRVENGTRGLVKHEGTNVYCPTTSTGFFMCRRNGHIYVSGNSNYGMGIDKLAKMAGIPFNLAKQLQEFYFYLNPEVKVWQDNVAKDIATKGYITNIFGRKAWFLNKNDPTLLNKALAFKPQGGIADLVNHAWVSIRTQYPDKIKVSAQVHDSLVCQYKLEDASWARKAIIDCMEIPLEFPTTTLIIPADLKVSSVSYGDTKKPKETII